MKRRTQRSEERQSEHEQREEERLAQMAATKAASKGRRKAARARDRAVKKKYGTTSVWSTGATDASRIQKDRTKRRIAEEKGQPVEVRYACICPKPTCRAHEIDSALGPLQWTADARGPQPKPRQVKFSGS